MSRARLIFIVFFATAVMIATVWLRTSSSRIFYQHRGAQVEQQLLQQQLGQKQLEMHRLTNPGAISETVTDTDQED